MIDASRRHKDNVLRLERTLNFLQESESLELGKQPPSVDLKFMEFIQKWRDSGRGPVDYEMVSYCQENKRKTG
jgi:hypothetical protein